jgi:hypothetical protein
VASGRVVFGINAALSDYRRDRKKRLDLVVARPSLGGKKPKAIRSLVDLVQKYSIILSDEEDRELRDLPAFSEGPVGSVLIALEAKACMTEFGKARPRLYDELTSSQQTINGATGDAVAAALVMVNSASSFISPLRNKIPLVRRKPIVTIHKDALMQAESVVQRMKAITRRSRAGDDGFDGLGVIVVDCKNDGSPIRLVTSTPAPPADDIQNYELTIRRLTQAYDTRFRLV